MTDHVKVDAWVWRCDRHGLNPIEFRTCMELIDDTVARGHGGCEVQFFRLHHPDTVEHEVTVAELLERLTYRIKHECSVAEMRGYNRGALHVQEVQQVQQRKESGEKQS